jgi:hypothetical protein
MSLPTPYNLLSEYRNPWFVETGAYRGDSIQMALDAGFQHIISIDNDPDAINFCRNRFDLNNPMNPHNERIMMVLGDSANILGAVLRMIHLPATILLDAHWQLIEDTERGPNPFPLMDELQQIDDHEITSHTIIIDDFLYMTHPLVTHFKAADVMNQLHHINERYQLRFVANPVINNILVAHL